MSPKLLVWGLIMLWVAALTVIDWRTRQVPNWAVYPLTPVALVVVWFWPLHGAYGPSEALYIAAGLIACGVIWYWRVLSGGDIKLAVPLVILLPDAAFYWAFLGVGAVGSVLMLMLWDGGAGRNRLRSLFFTTLTGQRLPSVHDTRTASALKQPPATWMVGLPAIFVIVGVLAT